MQNGDFDDFAVFAKGGVHKVAFFDIRSKMVERVFAPLLVVCDDNAVFNAVNAKLYGFQVRNHLYCFFYSITYKMQKRKKKLI